jgi:hypothetical protein
LCLTTTSLTHRVKKNYKEWSCNLTNKTLSSFNIWSSIYYAYIGSSLGFSEEELLSGPGVTRAQQGFANVKDEYWREKFVEIGEADFFVDLDDPQIKEGIKIGIKLWEDNGSNLSTAKILDMVQKRSQSAFAKKSCSKCG